MVFFLLKTNDDRKRERFIFAIAKRKNFFCDRQHRLILFSIVTKYEGKYVTPTAFLLTFPLISLNFAFSVNPQPKESTCGSC